MKKNKSFIRFNNEVLANSIKRISFSIILIIILDALFYFMADYILVYWQAALELKQNSLDIPNPEDIAALGYEKAQEALSQGHSFLFFMIFSTVLAVLALIFLAAIFKGIIWAKTTKTKISLGFLSRFLTLNLLWMGSWFLILILISLLVEPYLVAFYSIIALFLSLFFANTIYAIFMKKQGIKSILEGIKLNISKFHLLLLPYAAILFVLYMIFLLSGFLDFQYSIFALYAALIAYAAFVRYYVSELVTRIKSL